MKNIFLKKKVAVAPEHLTIEEGFFLCGGNVVIQAIPKFQVVNGLNIINNEFDCNKNQTVVLDQRLATFTDFTDVVIKDNMASSDYKVKSTLASQQLTLMNATKWIFDFSSELLLPSIYSIQYSIQIQEPGVFARHTSRPPDGLTVVIETDVHVSATVFVTVDQNKPSKH